MSEHIRPQDNDIEKENTHEFFPTLIERAQLIYFTSLVTNYLHEYKISNMVLLDRSARPFYVAIREYWKHAYKDDAMPGMYFANPKGFTPTAEAGPGELALDSIDPLRRGDRYSTNPEHLRTREEIAEELKEVYKELEKQKDEPLLIFDTCLHIGRALGWSKLAFQNAGFTNIITCTANPPERTGLVQPDFYLSPTQPALGCFPFGEERMVNKNYEHVLSTRNPDLMERKQSIRLREEIKNIIKGFFENPKKEFQNLPDEILDELEYEI